MKLFPEKFQNFPAKHCLLCEINDLVFKSFMAPPFYLEDHKIPSSYLPLGTIAQLEPLGVDTIQKGFRVK